MEPVERLPQSASPYSYPHLQHISLSTLCLWRSMLLTQTTVGSASSMCPPTLPCTTFFDRRSHGHLFVKFLREALNGRLPLKHGSVRPQTLGKRVSDDPRHCIFRFRKHKKHRVFAKSKKKMGEQGKPKKRKTTVDGNNSTSKYK